ncbi:MAG TPA: SDR family oxidoreductase [Pyrinomonadaceae bacterium]|nr:SDR family oxidoreductase [Pyrinomonadaceae bacterium]
MVKALILGGNGMLGHKLVQQLAPVVDVYTTIRGDIHEYSRLGIVSPEKVFAGVDLKNADALIEIIEKLSPDVVINAAGIVKQRKTENNNIEPLMINAVLPRRLGVLAERLRFRAILLSTDCVFDGKKGNYSESDPPSAPDMYGVSKYLAEVRSQNCLTIRTSMIGREIGTSQGLVEWFLGHDGREVAGFTNAIFSGFPTVVLADIIANLILDHPNLNGLYHISSDPISKFNLLELISKAYDSKVIIEARDEPRIDRSLNSDKFRNETGFRPERWPEMIEQMALDPTPYNEWRK